MIKIEDLLDELSFDELHTLTKEDYKKVSSLIGQYITENESNERTRPSFKDFISENYSPFNWKTNKSEIDWHSTEPTKDHIDGKTGVLIHHARDPEMVRDNEPNEVKEKRGRGRPAGKYDGSYKPRSPESKMASAQKAMASKADGLRIRKEYKDAMNMAIKKKQEHAYRQSLE